jgi:uncharacterized protein (DUF362 family)
MSKTTQTPVQVVASADFIYQPPAAAINCKRILVKPNLGYPVAAPVTVSMEVLGAVLQGLRKASPNAEILVVEGVCSNVSLADIASRLGVYSLLDSGMQLLDADELPLKEYPNLSPSPVRFKSMFAPTILEEVDCRISVGTLKRTVLKAPLISASLKNLYGLFPRARYKARSQKSRGQLHRPSVPQVLQDVYFTIGHLFDDGVVDGNLKFISKDWQPDKGQAVELGKVFYGDDILAVDRIACEVGGETVPEYLDVLARMLTQGNH